MCGGREIRQTLDTTLDLSQKAEKNTVVQPACGRGHLFTRTMLLMHVVASSEAPEQVHLAYGDAPDSMVVSWATPGAAVSVVSFGPAGVSGTLPLSAVGSSERFRQLLNDSSPSRLDCQNCVDEYLHTATLSSLSPGVKYSYQIKGSLTRYTFTAKHSASQREWSPTFAVFGDLGSALPGGALSPSLQRLTEEVERGTINGILHVGDFAYDLWNEGGHRGDTFMRQIEPIAGRVPYMTCLGNHEGGTNFAGSLQVERSNLYGK